MDDTIAPVGDVSLTEAAMRLLAVNLNASGYSAEFVESHEHEHWYGVRYGDMFLHRDGSVSHSALHRETFLDCAVGIWRDLTPERTE